MRKIKVYEMTNGVVLLPVEPTVYMLKSDWELVERVLREVDKYSRNMPYQLLVPMAKLNAEPKVKTT